MDPHELFSVIWLWGILIAMGVMWEWLDKKEATWWRILWMVVLSLYSWVVVGRVLAMIVEQKEPPAGEEG